MTNDVALTPQRLIRAEVRRRMSPYLREKIPLARREEYEQSGKGWVVDKPLKTAVWMRRPKGHDVAFEDRVWAMCARLGFQHLSEGRNLRVPYGSGENERKQIDVLAADDEVVLVIECKSSSAEIRRTASFKTEIEAIRGYRSGILSSLRRQFPDHKVKFVFATNNINLSDAALDRISNSDIAFIDEGVIDYYHELAEHLGPAAKFQLLGNLFHGQKISAMDATVPAIRGKMGGYTYYSFAIEPSRLLKIAYVLHRNNANMKWMPTYQRIIKRPRLKQVSTFVENGGFFPNSLIINVDNGGKPLRFDRAPNQDATTTLGILHLPPKYRSAYVIDGQHRLFGYALSSRADRELVPVVAFVDMPGSKQLQMFMDINENQQSVPKNLRLTLKADLEWGNPDLRRQAQALRLKVAQLLGEDKASPLRGRVIIGEERATDRLCISLDAVGRGVERGRFIGDFSATEMRVPGSFYRGSIDATLNPLSKYLYLCFELLRDQLPGQWNAGRGEGGFVFTNAGVEAVLRLIGDLVDHLIAEGSCDPRRQEPGEVFALTKPLLGTLTDSLSQLPANEASAFRAWLGAGAPTKYLRQFQALTVNGVPGFRPEGFDEWKRDQEREFNTHSYSMIKDIETFLRDDIRRRLQDKYGADWYRSGVPQAVFRDGSTRAAEKQYDAEPGVHVEWWDCLYLIEYHKVLLHGGQAVWFELFDETYTLPSDRKSSWRSRAEWFNELNRARNKIAHNEAVTEAEYGTLQTLHSHFDLGGAGRDG